MWKLPVLFLSMVFTATKSEYVRRIYSGDYATQGQFAFAVSLRLAVLNIHFCGGSIINKNHVLSASHCVEKLKPSYVYVVAGVLENRPEGDKKLAVSELILHQQFRKLRTEYIADIALLKMAESIDFSTNVGPIDLGVLQPRHTLLAIGWGAVDSEEKPSRFLKFVEMSFVEGGRVCRSDRTRFCAGPRTKGHEATTCSGDSGGPVMDAQTRKLVGISSVGWIMCGNTSSTFEPDQYTKVGAYLDWIKENSAE